MILYWHRCMSHRSSQSKHGDIIPTRVSGVVFFKAINLVSQCAPRQHQEVIWRSLARKLIWGPSDKTTDVRAAKKRRQSQGTREGAGTSRVFHQANAQNCATLMVKRTHYGNLMPLVFSPGSKLMHRICATLVVKWAYYGNLMPLVFSSHWGGILGLFLAGE